MFDHVCDFVLSMFSTFICSDNPEDVKVKEAVSFKITYTHVFSNNVAKFLFHRTVSIHFTFELHILLLYRRTTKDLVIQLH